jgi:hypothetical protein
MWTFSYWLRSNDIALRAHNFSVNEDHARVSGSVENSLMSALGQKQTWRDVRRMSALPPKADITASQNVR